LQSLVEEIPNARDRLAYVGKMTEDAANKVLSLVETAKPGCDALAAQGVALERALSGAPLNAEQTPGLLADCRQFAGQAAAFAEGQGAVLDDIMMTQSFQDLSGQVIKKVIDIITRTERQLVTLLIESAPAAASGAQAATNVDTHKLEGPQTAEKALQQNDVDDLLASLGF
jgi:chemotaxis protein CheZ